MAIKVTNQMSKYYTSIEKVKCQNTLKIHLFNQCKDKQMAYTLEKHRNNNVFCNHYTD